MITNIINPLLQAISFISIWYLYQTMSKVKPLRGHLLLLFLSFVAAASYFSLVKIVIDPLFFLLLIWPLSKSVLSIIDCFTLFIQLSFLIWQHDYFQLSLSLTSYISKVMLPSTLTYIYSFFFNCCIFHC